MEKLARSNKFGPSYIEIDNKKILELVNEYAGEGIIRRNNSGKLLDEVITTNDNYVGICVNDISGKEVSTTVFKIKYHDKNGIHIIPDYPSKKGAKQRD